MFHLPFEKSLNPKYEYSTDLFCIQCNQSFNCLKRFKKIKDWLYWMEIKVIGFSVSVNEV
jgi:hypothetical protein